MKSQTAVYLLSSVLPGALLLGLLLLVVPLSAMAQSSDQGTANSAESADPVYALHLQLYYVGTYTGTENDFRSDRQMLRENQGLLTIRLRARDRDALNAAMVQKWIQEGILFSNQLTLDPNTVTRTGPYTVTVLFEVDSSGPYSFMETDLRVTDNGPFSSAETRMSVFPHNNHKLDLHIDSDGSEWGDPTIAKREITVQPLLFESLTRGITEKDASRAGHREYIIKSDSAKARLARNISNRDVPFVALSEAGEEHQAKGMFRTRNLVITGSTLVVSGTTVLLTGGGASPVILPDPPGRP